MATSKAKRSAVGVVCVLCGCYIPAGKTYRMVFDDAGAHVGNRCHTGCKTEKAGVAGNGNQRVLITKKLAELEADERLSYPVATVFENAPLALVQCGLENQVRTLKWVLKVLEGEV